MKTYTFNYIHVPPTWRVHLGLDRVENRTVTIEAVSKKAAKELFDKQYPALQ